jgi:hypothetical protein
MTHTFKLARRIARLKLFQGDPTTASSAIRFFQLLPSAVHVFAAALLVALATGCTDNEVTDITSAAPEPVSTHMNNVARVLVTPDSLTLSVGTTGQASCKVWHRSGSVIVGRACNWGSKDTMVATVTSGVATATIRAKKVGRTIIWAGAGGHRDTLTVTVVATPAPSQVAVTPESTTVETGKTVQFAATGTWSNDSTAPIAVTWTATGGTITSGGLYTAGQTAGTYRAIGSAGGRADTARVVVKAPLTTCVSSATHLCPGDDWQAKVNSAGAGTVFTIAAGVHRLQTVTPKSGQQFVGEPGAIMSGAKLLTGWVQSGAVWYVGGQTQEFAHNVGVCASGTACQYPEDVYRDDVLLHRELSLGAVGPGDFYFDYAADRIYVGDAPTGHQLEAAATEYAFNGTPQGVGSNVTIRGLVIEKYATPAQYGAVGRTFMGTGWVVRDNEIRYNHGLGLHTGNSIVVAKNNLHHNGQLGLGGAGRDQRVDSNTVAYNNTAGFAPGWEAGGFKWAAGVANSIARGNFVHHNKGIGMWCDGYCDAVTYTGNRIEDNDWDGIQYEISYRVTITNNVIARNGLLQPNADEGAGIMISNSGGTGSEVSGNTLVGNKNGIILLQADRGSGPQGPYVTQNVSVHDNTVTLGPRAVHGAVQYAGDGSLWTTRNNHFEHNTYNLQTADLAPFAWAGAHRSESQWRAYGNDDTGSFSR